MRTSRLLRVTAVAAVLALGAAACSGSEETAETTTTEPAAAPTTDMTTEPATEAATTDLATELGATEGTDDVSGEGMDAGGEVDIVQSLEDAGLNGLAAAVQASGLSDELESLPEFTVFAPTDEALAALGADIASIDPQELRDTLTYHVVDQRLLSTDLTEGENTVDTLAGSPLTVTVQGDTVTVGDGATVVQPDVEVGQNGVVHVIDQVLQPGA